MNNVGDFIPIQIQSQHSSFTVSTVSDLQFTPISQVESATPAKNPLYKQQLHHGGYHNSGCLQRPNATRSAVNKLYPSEAILIGMLMDVYNYNK